MYAQKAERCSGAQRGKRATAVSSAGSSGGTGSACASLSAAAASSDAACDAASSLCAEYLASAVATQQLAVRYSEPGRAQCGCARGDDGVRF